MTRKIILATAAIFFAVSAIAQDVKKETPKEETKMEAFVSKTGIIIKLIDTKQPALKLIYGDIAETRIRKIISGTESKYFYQIEHKGKYSTSTASIAYTDLIEVIKAIKALNSDLVSDIALNPDYLENKFTTSDGFKIGYLVDKGTATWYLRLEKYGSDNTIFIKEGGTIETAFTEAKKKIDDLSK